MSIYPFIRWHLYLARATFSFPFELPTHTHITNILLQRRFKVHMPSQIFECQAFRSNLKRKWLPVDPLLWVCVRHYREIKFTVQRDWHFLEMFLRELKKELQIHIKKHCIDLLYCITRHTYFKMKITSDYRAWHEEPFASVSMMDILMIILTSATFKYPSFKWYFWIGTFERRSPCNTIKRRWPKKVSADGKACSIYLLLVAWMNSSPFDTRGHRVLYNDIATKSDNTKCWFLVLYVSVMCGCVSVKRTENCF